MPPLSATILERFRRGRPGDIDLTLRPAYRDLLHKLGHPHNRLPPVLHVAGTNGKGSTCAFMRAILEAAGHRVHVYTSPHLVNFHERIRVAGKLIAENDLIDILTECERVAEPGGITYFEAATATAFTSFARHAADFTILETGLGGRLDATNIVEKPLATIITRISYDHREYLGTTLGDIAREKAGIMRAGVPCFTAPQPDAESLDALRASASSIGAPLFVGGKDWCIEPGENSFRFTYGNRAFDLPLPALPGAHQLWNAGLAIAALLGTECHITESAVADGLRNVEWPARLQLLKAGALAKILPQGWELWLDGGHNDSAGEVLAAWAAKDPKPLYLVTGMMGTKSPAEFLGPLAPHITALRAVHIPGEQSFSGEELATLAAKAGIKNAAPAKDVWQALEQIAQSVGAQNARVLICGSLYLAGDVLKGNGQ